MGGIRKVVAPTFVADLAAPVAGLTQADYARKAGGMCVRGLMVRDWGDEFQTTARKSKIKAVDLVSL